MYKLLQFYFTISILQKGSIFMFVHVQLLTNFQYFFTDPLNLSFILPLTLKHVYLGTFDRTLSGLCLVQV